MSSEPARVRIEILPPIWGRAWFVALTLAAFVLSVFAAHRIRVASLRHRTLQLTRTVTERTAELERARAKLEEANQGLEQRVKEGIEALRESERMAAYGHLIAKVAHEVRHPIFSLQASAYVLADKLRNKDGFDKQLRVLERETGRMSTLMNDLLDFARPAELSLDETEPSSLLSEAIESFCSAPNADETPDIRVEVAEGLPGVMLDRTRMLEVFVNLMENARRHAQGATLLSLRACQGEGTLRFVIEDDGVGIPEDKLPHVFEPFYTGGNGTGLGLAIVRRIVLDHGGTIRVESKPGEGSAFVIDLPTREPSEQGS